MSKVIRITDRIESAIKEYREQLIIQVNRSNCCEDAKYTIVNRLEEETEQDLILDALIFAINH